MVVSVGKVTGRTVGTNRDGTDDVVLLQVEVSDSDDIQTVELHRGAGVDFNPPDGSIVSLIRAGNAWQIAATTNDNVEPDGLDEGDYQIYASASGAKTAKVHCENGGDVIINDGAQSAVSFPELKAQFDVLVTDFNNLVAIFNAHVHPGVVPAPVPPGASTLVTITPGTSSIATVDNSESDTIKVP